MRRDARGQLPNGVEPDDTVSGTTWCDPASRRCDTPENPALNEEIADWGDADWLEDEPEEPAGDILAEYHRPISKKEKICETCNIPKPCWCD